MKGLDSYLTTTDEDREDFESAERIRRDMREHRMNRDDSPSRGRVYSHRRWIDGKSVPDTIGTEVHEADFQN